MALISTNLNTSSKSHSHITKLMVTKSKRTFTKSLLIISILALSELSHLHIRTPIQSFSCSSNLRKRIPNLLFKLYLKSSKLPFNLHSRFKVWETSFKFRSREKTSTSKLLTMLNLKEISNARLPLRMIMHLALLLSRSLFRLTQKH